MIQRLKTTTKKHLNLFVNLVVSVATFSNAEAATLWHPITANDSAFSVLSQSACAVYSKQPDPMWCNPALFGFNDGSVLNVDVLLHSNKEAFNDTARVSQQDMDEEFVRKLFGEKGFQSFAAMGRLTARSNYLSLSYVPMHAFGAYQISNPAFPELIAIAERQSNLSLHSGKMIAEVGPYKLYAGLGLTAFKRDMYRVDADIIEISFKQVSQLIQRDEKTGIDIDFGFAAIAGDSSYLPSFSATALRANQELSREETTAQQLDTRVNHSRLIAFSLGKTIQFSQMNHLHVEANFPFSASLDQQIPEKISYATIGGIGRFRGSLSFSQVRRGVGFYFMTTHYHLGVQSTSDKEPNALELERQQNSQIFASFYF